MNLLDETIKLFEESGLSVPDLAEQAGVPRRTCYCILNRDYDTGVSKVQLLYDFLVPFVEKQKKQKKKKQAA